MGTATNKCKGCPGEHQEVWDCGDCPQRQGAPLDRDGKYIRCGHPDNMDCQCYGRLHEGEVTNLAPEVKEIPLKRKILEALLPPS